MQSAGCAVSCLAQLTPRQGDVQAAATAEQADCWSQWPSKSHSGEDKGSAGGGERGMTTSPCLPVAMRGCSKLSSSGAKVQRVQRATEQIIFCVCLAVNFTLIKLALLRFAPAPCTSAAIFTPTLFTQVLP